MPSPTAAMSTSTVLMTGTLAAANTSRIPYASMSVLEIFYDYCVSGVDFSLPGNGGKDCAAVLSNGRRLFESVMTLTAGTREDAILRCLFSAQ